MRKIYIIALVLTLLPGCSKTDFLETGSNSNGDSGCAITFNGKSTPVTKATGADAAALLGGSFIVNGAKTVNNSSSTVFDGYNVKWVEDSNGDYAWRYIDQQDATNSVQTVKYWDNNASKYTYVAFSKGGGNARFDNINLCNIGTDQPIYTVTGQPNNDQLYPVYLADIVTVGKANFGQPVSISFRPFRTKVRFGIYETIPGYSVENVTFYHTADIEYTGGAYPVVFPDGQFMPSMGEFEYSVYSSGDDGRLSVQYALKEGVMYKSNIAFDALAYSSDGMLGTTSANPSYFLDSRGNSYIDVLPIGDHSGKLGIRVDFTLVPLDGSDSHKITVRDVMAYVPEEFVRWQPGYAYTYLFKISDAVDGLYPITFDAKEYLASDPLDAETIEGEISITTYQKGSAMEDSGAYNTTDNIYVTVGNYSQLQKLSVGQNGYVRLYQATGNQQVTEKAVQNCIVNGQYDNSKYSYTITDAAGRILILTDITKDMSILHNYGNDDYPNPSWEDSIKYKGIACISSKEAGTYVFVYRPHQSDRAKFNTLTKGDPCYSFEEEEYEDGNVYYMDYFTATGFETYDAENPIINDTYIHNDYMYPISDDRNDYSDGYETSYSMILDLKHFYYYYKDEYYYEMYGNTNLRIADYNFYRLYPATYFTEYNIGDIIAIGDIYFERLYWQNKENPPIENTNYTFYKYSQNKATESIEITADNVEQYVYLRKGTHKVNNTLFYSVIKTNNTKLKSAEWYWAVDGYDGYENDDGTYDDPHHIYVEEKKSSPKSITQELLDIGQFGELMEVVEWEDGTYGEWYYSEYYTTEGPGSYKDYLGWMGGFYNEDRFCTLAPISYIYCDGSGNKQIYNADGTEMRSDVYDKISISSDELYMDDKSATMYSKIITVR